MNKRGLLEERVKEKERREGQQSANSHCRPLAEQSNGTGESWPREVASILPHLQIL